MVHTGEIEPLLRRARQSGPGRAAGSAETGAAGGYDSSGGEGGDEGGKLGGGGVDAGGDGGPTPRPLRLLDCGCGSALLTFGAFHYLRHVRGAAVELDGVDTNAALMERSNRRGGG